MPFKNNLNLIREKIKRLDKDINNAEKDVEKDLSRIINKMITGNNEDEIRERERLLTQIDRKLLVDTKKKYLNEAKRELEELAQELELKKNLFRNLN